MIEKATIEKLVNEYLSGTDIFLVAVRKSSTGKITVLADRREGITIAECVGISRFIEKNLSHDDEEYELQVSSPGLDMPFLVLQQYYKCEGRAIEVLDLAGNKHSGVLKNVTDGGFELEIELTDRTKGKTKSVEKTFISLNYDQVRSAREIVTFK